MNNQYVTLLPGLLNINEFDDFSTTVTINYAPPPTVLTTYDYVFHDVIKDATIPTWCLLTYVANGSLSFTLSGNMSDVFDRKLKYIDTNMQKQQVKYFSDIPTDYQGIYGYSSASGEVATFNLNVRMRPTTYNYFNVPPAQIHEYEFKLLVASNFTKANERFVEVVNNGSLAKMAPV